MPQPLTEIPGQKSYALDHLGFRARPELAAMAMECIALMSQVDHYKGLILACLLRGDVSTSLAMYMSLRSDAAKKSVLNSAAKRHMSADEHEILDRLEKKTKSAVRRRNEFAHGLWGHCDQLPDALLLAPSEQYLDVLDSSQSRSDLDFGLAEMHQTSSVMVFKKNDFEQSLKLAFQAFSWYHNFYEILKFKRVSEAVGRNQNEAAAEFFEDMRKNFDELWLQLKSDLL